MRAHQHEFGPVQPPAATVPEPVDLNPLTKQFERDALHGVSMFDRAGRKEARATAINRARQEAAVETQRQAAAAAEEQSRLNEGWQRLLANDAQAVFHQLEAAFEDNQAPSAPIDCDGDRVIVAMFLPPVDALVPPRKVATTPSGTPTIHKRNKTEQNGLYAMVLASNVVATAKEAFAVAPGIRYVTTVVLEKDDQARRVGALYVGSFRPEQVAGKLTDDGVLALLNAGAQAVNQKGRSNQLAPIDVTQEPDLERVMRQIASDLSYTSPGVAANQTGADRRRATTADKQGSGMLTILEVPIVREQPHFLVMEEERLQAMRDATAASNPEQGLSCAMVVNKLYELQLDQFSDLVDEAGELSTFDPRRDDCLDWMRAWTDDAEQRHPEWASYQKPSSIRSVARVRSRSRTKWRRPGCKRSWIVRRKLCESVFARLAGQYRKRRHRSPARRSMD